MEFTILRNNFYITGVFKHVVLISAYLSEKPNKAGDVLGPSGEDRARQPQNAGIARTQAGWIGERQKQASIKHG